MNNTLKTILITISLLIILSIILIGLGDALTPLLISFGLTYLVFPLIKKLEKKGVPRSYAVTGVFTSFLIFAALCLTFSLPPLISDTKVFLKELPLNSTKAIKKIETLSIEMGHPIQLSKDSITTYLSNHISEFSGGILGSLSKGLKSSFSGVAKWLIAILNLFLIPLFFFYVVNDYEKIYKEIKFFIPKAALPKLKHYLNLSNNVFSGYIRGQLMVALTLGLLYAFGLSIVGLRFGIIIGLLAGLISIIPYAGFTIGFFTAIIMALANDSGIGQIIGITSIFIIIQTLEGIIITPKLVGDKVGLGPLSTILALIIGGNLFGLTGMIAAIPVAAVSKTLIKDLKSEYQDLEFNKN